MSATPLREKVGVLLARMGLTPLSSRSWGGEKKGHFSIFMTWGGCVGIRGKVVGEAAIYDLR